MLGHHGPNLHQLNSWNKSRVRHAHSVNAEGEVLRGVAAVVANGKVKVKLIAFADQFSGGAEDRTLRVTHVNLQFSAIPLGCSRHRQKPQATQKADDPNEPRHHDLNVVSGSFFAFRTSIYH